MDRLPNEHFCYFGGLLLEGDKMLARYCYNRTADMIEILENDPDADVTKYVEVCDKARTKWIEARKYLMEVAEVCDYFEDENENEE